MEFTSTHYLTAVIKNKLVDTATRAVWRAATIPIRYETVHAACFVGGSNKVLLERRDSGIPSEWHIYCGLPSYTQLQHHFQNHLMASTAITAVGWNKDGTVNWSLKSNGEYRSDDVSTAVTQFL